MMIFNISALRYSSTCGCGGLIFGTETDRQAPFSKEFHEVWSNSCSLFLEFIQFHTFEGTQFIDRSCNPTSERKLKLQLMWASCSVLLFLHLNLNKKCVARLPKPAQNWFFISVSLSVGQGGWLENTMLYLIYFLNVWVWKGMVVKNGAYVVYVPVHWESVHF